MLIFGKVDSVKLAKVEAAEEKRERKRKRNLAIAERAAVKLNDQPKENQ